MNTVQPVAVATTRVTTPSYVEWGPVFAGAVGAAAVSFVLLTFGAAIGLSITSPWPGRGASMTAVAWAVAWWTMLAKVGAFAGGGYLAGRMRGGWDSSATDEGKFRDAAHGFLVWAVGLLFGAVVLALSTGSLVRTASQSASVVAAGAGQNGLAGPTDYAVDLLLRPSGAGTAGAAADAARGDDAVLRAEANRIFAATIRNQEFTERDRTYLTQVVTRRAGLPAAEAQTRVDAALNEARDLEIKARAAAEKARKAAVIAGFIAAASLLISCAAAIAAANVGGRHRDEAKLPDFYGHRFW